MSTENKPTTIFRGKEIYWKGPGLYHLSPPRELNIWLKVERKFSSVEWLIKNGCEVTYVYYCEVIFG